jgi:hypothetical protein
MPATRNRHRNPSRLTRRVVSLDAAIHSVLWRLLQGSERLRRAHRREQLKIPGREPVRTKTLRVQRLHGCTVHARRWRRQARGDVSRRDGWRLRRNLPVLSLAARTSQRLISQPLLRFKSDTPHVEYGQAEACPRAAQKSATYRSLRFLQWQRWCRRQAQ